MKKSVWNQAKAAFTSISTMDKEGIWALAGGYIEWEQIEEAQIIWRYKTPYMLLKLKRKKIWDLGKVEMPLFYRDFESLRADVRRFCPSEHVFAKAFPTELPKKPYRLYYLLRQAGAVVIACLVMVVLFGYGISSGFIHFREPASACTALQNHCK